MSRLILDLKSIPILARRILHNHGLITLEQLFGKLSMDVGDVFLKRVLNLNRKQRRKLRSELKTLLGKTFRALQALPLAAGLLGLACSTETVKKVKVLTNPAKKHYLKSDLPDEVNHAWDMPSVRDQGDRGTCVAFSMNANREFILSNPEHLSEQYLYNRCKAIDGHDGPGTYLETAVEVLTGIGVCRESSWPYNPNQIDDNEGQDPPPVGVEEEACRFKILRHKHIEECDIELMMRLLSCGEDGSPNLVTIGVSVFRNAWANPYTVRTGILYMPTEEEMWVGAHAITLVGYRIDDQLPGGGAFIFRNSWGTDKWSIDGHPDGLYPPGYGFIPFAYVSSYGMQAYALTQGVDANSYLSIKKSKSFIAVTLGIIVAFFLIASGFSHFKPENLNHPIPNLQQLDSATTKTSDVSLDDYKMVHLPIDQAPFTNFHLEMNENRDLDYFHNAMNTIWSMERLLGSLSYTKKGDKNRNVVSEYSKACD